MSHRIVSSSDTADYSVLEPVHHMIFQYLLPLDPVKFLRVSQRTYDYLLPDIYRRISINETNAFDFFALLLHPSERQRKALALTEVLSLEDDTAARMLKIWIDREKRESLKNNEDEKDVKKLFPNVKHLHFGWGFIHRVLVEFRNNPTWEDSPERMDDGRPLKTDTVWENVITFGLAKHLHPKQICVDIQSHSEFCLDDIDCVLWRMLWALREKVREQETNEWNGDGTEEWSHHNLMIHCVDRGHLRATDPQLGHYTILDQQLMPYQVDFAFTSLSDDEDIDTDIPTDGQTEVDRILCKMVRSHLISMDSGFLNSLPPHLGKIDYFVARPRHLEQRLEDLLVRLPVSKRREIEGIYNIKDRKTMQCACIEAKKA